ncbi:hypothetical protein EDD52_10170 [Primorskyibacter sedentarius]|uniref:Uncharacterized protein n=1 Tax=Primorskyibacter sedentarius TaxID=745311 RepID=A0A4R3JL90_9RHOB|nr:hypothetical protein EDD52_10170 [Primorskyibacter sedentarius]
MCEVLTVDDFRADCTRCAGLCCVAFPFDKSEDFALDKPVDVPCPNLRQDYKCRIHDSLAEKGFSGCVRYDCLGAGQIVTQELYRGIGWRENPAQFAPMMDAFRKAREVQSLRAMLTAAARFPLSEAENAARLELLTACTPSEEWSISWIEGILSGPLPTDVRSFVASLKHHIERPG